MSSETDTTAAVERILAGLGEPGAFDAAERRIAPVAGQLQVTLDKALAAGGWFDEAHEGAVLKAATTPDEQARLDAVRNLVLEQTRLGMLVGVAVGWEIAERLAEGRGDGRSGRQAEGPGHDDRAGES